ncbi:MAG: PhnD/SsuA/transferrin family substrate-binding protein [Caldimicrobium sp.]|nr:PhnD/SsuA/transferrin family substrate-binding protein [Caldimicrobium sp.]MCX7873390.1 PhnD/SsuA/transferrin family substrate-binding protein [Caldimicrobium sp.]MDW8094368.1 PhnD/SsuA/transferrin family substrate-binding protein [Caldimicrobium sp.]
MGRVLGFLFFLIFLISSLSSSFAQNSLEKPLVFGILAKRGEDIERNRFYQLKEFLRKSIPYHIEFRFLPFEELRRQALEGSLTFILTNPYQSILIRELAKEYDLNYRIILSLGQREKGGYYPYFGGVIFTKKESPIKSLEDIKGKELGAVDPESFGGYLIALHELHKVGIGEKDIKPKFYGTHDAVVYAVLRGEVPVGTVRTGILERLNATGLISLEDLRIINSKVHPNFPLLISSPLYPEWPILALEGTPQEIVKAVAKALLEIDEKSPLAENIEGIFYLPLDYTSLDRILLDLMKGPYAELREIYFQKFKEKFLPHVVGFLILVLVTLLLLSYSLYRRNKLLKDTKANLEKEKTFLDKVLEHTDFMVFYLTLEGKVLWANQKGERVCPENQEGNEVPLWLLCPVLYQINTLQRYFQNKDYEKGPINFVETLEGEDRERTYEGELIPLKKGDKIEGILFFLRDITEKVILEKQTIFLEKLNVLKNVAGGLAHDFNNQLLAVMNQIELLKARLNNKKINPEARALFDSITETLMGLRLLGRELLTLVRGESPVKEKADLAELIKHYTSIALAGKKNYEVQYDIKDHLPLVEVDKELFSIMWMNLVLNAIEAMPKGGKISIKIEPFQRDQRPWLRFSIKDEGIGFPEKYKSRIFEPFFTTKPGGSGLGLYVVNEVVKAHNGRIEVSSTEGKGSIFTIEFPALSGEFVPIKRSSLYTKKKKILLMDDDDLVRDTLKELLEHFDYEVDTAPNGETAFELYQQTLKEGKPYDYVILDLIVPGHLNGLDTFQKIKELDSKAQAIIISGYFDKPIMQDFKAYGLKGALIKPFTIQQLLELLET